MYELGQFNVNILMDYTKEEREKQVEERKKNRHKYRSEFNSVMHLYRTNDGPNFMKAQLRF